MRVALKTPLWDTIAHLITGAINTHQIIFQKRYPLVVDRIRSNKVTYRFQMIRVLSREPDKSMLGFSREVARD